MFIDTDIHFTIILPHNLFLLLLILSYGWKNDKINLGF